MRTGQGAAGQPPFISACMKWKKPVDSPLRDGVKSDIIKNGEISDF